MKKTIKPGTQDARCPVLSQYGRQLFLLAAATVLFNCASPEQAGIAPANANNAGTQNEAPASAGGKQSAGGEQKADTLSDFSATTIQTSNGEITIEPTVVSTDDATQAQAENSELAKPQNAYYDPLEFINRPVFSFNHFTYKYLFIPLAKGYNYLIPADVRHAISNGFNNLREPLNLLNNALSGEFSEAGSNLGRFLINSTVGILGFFDPADAWFGIKEKPQTLSQTLMKYNVGGGAYVVLPLLGRSDIRGTTSIIGESLVHPTKYVFESPDDTVARAVDGFDDFSQQADTYITLFEASEDPYIYFRNQYIQSVNRDEMAQDIAQSEVNVAGVNKDE